MNPVQRIPRNWWAFFLTVFGSIAIFCLGFAVLYMAGALAYLLGITQASSVEPFALTASVLLTVFITTDFARVHNGHWVEALTNTSHSHDQVT